jgi:hypothetical protein
VRAFEVEHGLSAGVTVQLVFPRRCNKYLTVKQRYSHHDIIMFSPPGPGTDFRRYLVNPYSEPKMTTNQASLINFDYLLPM